MNTPVACARHWTEDYERLRRSRHHADEAAGRNGRAVLIHRGMAAWFAVIETAGPAPVPPRTTNHSAVPDLCGDVEAGLVDIIVAIAMSHLPGAAS